MLEEKIPASRTNFSAISPQIETNIGMGRVRRRSERISPYKEQKNRIEKTVNRKLNNVIEDMIESCYEVVIN